MGEFLDRESATEQSTQDISEKIEQKLYGSNDEPDVEEEEVSEDADELPEDDDSESDEDGSEELADEVSDEDFSLASQMGVDEDRLKVSEDGSVVFEAIVDGEKKDVSLKDLATSFQMQGHVNNKSMALENERKEFANERARIGEELQKRAEGIEGMSKLLENQLVGEYNGIDWETLRSTDPAEYTALRQDFSDRAKQLQHQKQLVAEETKRNLETTQQENAKQLQEHIQQEFGKLLESNPEWKDEAKYKTDMTNIKSFVTETYNFTEEDLNVVTDHRLMNLIKDAYAYRNGKKSAEGKKVKSIPKFQKPGVNRTSAKNLEKARAVKSKRAAVRKSGSVQDVANLLLDRM